MMSVQVVVVVVVVIDLVFTASNLRPDICRGDLNTNLFIHLRSSTFHHDTVLYRIHHHCHCLYRWLVASWLTRLKHARCQSSDISSAQDTQDQEQARLNDCWHDMTRYLLRDGHRTRFLSC